MNRTLAQFKIEFRGQAEVLAGKLGSQIVDRILEIAWKRLKEESNPNDVSLIFVSLAEARNQVINSSDMFQDETGSEALKKIFGEDLVSDLHVGSFANIKGTLLPTLTVHPLHVRVIAMCRLLDWDYGTIGAFLDSILDVAGDAIETAFDLIKVHFALGIVRDNIRLHFQGDCQLEWVGHVIQHADPLAEATSWAAFKTLRGFPAATRYKRKNDKLAWLRDRFQDYAKRTRQTVAVSEFCKPRSEAI